MSLSPNEWHARFTEQARWTYDLRQYLYDRIGLERANKVLDVGCGTGVLMGELLGAIQGNTFGLDINADFLAIARFQAPDSLLIQSDCHTLPFPGRIFDIALCHFLLLWVLDPFWVVSEMARVTHQGGWVLALAEPDYGGRIDYPPELEQLGIWQKKALTRLGARPEMGRRLAGIFSKAGFQDVETGVIGGQWAVESSVEEWTAEWKVLLSDLEDTIPFEEINSLRDRDALAHALGERVLFVPTFYAIGRVA